MTINTDSGNKELIKRKSQVVHSFKYFNINNTGKWRLVEQFELVMRYFTATKN